MKMIEQAEKDLKDFLENILTDFTGYEVLEIKDDDAQLYNHDKKVLCIVEKYNGTTKYGNRLVNSLESGIQTE